MKHIELLTMESYLETKKDLIENSGHTLKELDIEHGEKITEIIEEIYNEYFGKRGDDEQETFMSVGFKKKDTCYEVWTINKYYWHRDSFLKRLKKKYKKWFKKKKESKIIEEIERTLVIVYVFSCRFHDDMIKKTYEIIKYTLTKEVKCNYWNNGKFLKEMYKKEDEGDEVVFPFEIKDAELPIYCQEVQRILFDVHRKIFINPRKKGKYSDITRFSFYNVNKVVTALIDTLKEKNSENYKEDNKDYDKGYVEGREDYVVLDEILGITLTNIIYWKTRKVEDRDQQENIIKVVSYLAKCRYSIGRNFVAQVLMDYLEAVDYNAKIIQEIEMFLKREIQRWNECYEEIEAVSLCGLFSYLKECSDSDLIKVCKDIQDDDWSKYIYMEEISRSSDMIKVEEVQGHEKESKIRIPKKGMDSRTWYAYIHKAVFEAIWS